MKRWRATALRLLALLALSGLALQGFWLLRIGAMAVIDPQSTSFERSEAWRLITEKHRLNWSQSWRSYPAISDHLKRAVIASEDAGFTDHSGIEWDAIEKAWTRNQKAQARAAAAPSRRGPPKIFGGSTITQQLAKNLFLSGERSVLRKMQEALITLMLEAVLDKQRILEIYLNHVEWGEGVFGAQAAAQHHFRTESTRLQSAQAARLAVMLPAPKRFEKQPASPYLVSRSTTVMARMPAVDLP